VIDEQVRNWSFFCIFLLIHSADGMMLLRIKKPDLKRSYKTFGYPVTPLLFILVNLWIIYFCIKSRPITSLFGLGTIGLGVLFYTYFKKKNRVAGKNDSA